MKITEPTKLTETVIDGETVVQLYIEPYEFHSAISLTEEPSVLTDSYEITLRTQETQIQSNLTHNVKEVEGSAFYIPQEATLGYVSRLTDWEFDDQGEVTNISVPDEPYDLGNTVVPSGSYRVWEEKPDS